MMKYEELKKIKKYGEQIKKYGELKEMEYEEVKKMEYEELMKMIKYEKLINTTKYEELKKIMKCEKLKKEVIEKELKREKYEELKKMKYEELKKLKHEFIRCTNVKVFRLNDNLLESSILIVFRVHDLVQVMKDDPSTSLEQIVRKGIITSGHLCPPSNTTIPDSSTYFSPRFFKRIVLEANLFHSDNNQIVYRAVNRYLDRCFNRNVIKPDPHTKYVLVIEVMRKFVYIGDTGGEHPAEFNLQAEELEKSCSEIARDREDYSEDELRDILGSVYDLKIKHGYKLSMNAPTETYRLSQIKATIRRLIFSGKSTEDNRCPICWKKFCDREQIVKMPCSHIFHINCASKWLLHHADSCPMCRSVCKTPII